MADQSVFDKPAEGTTNTSTNEANPYEGLLASIKNENGEQKYKTVEEALKGLANAQEYIPKLHQQIDTLKGEKSSLEENYNKALSNDEKFNKLLEEMRMSREEYKQDTGDAFLEKPQEPPETPKEPEFDEDKLYQSFRNRMKGEEEALIQSSNLDNVGNILIQMYGDKAYDIITQKANDLGMDVEDIKQLAARSPKAALNLLGVNKNNEFNVSSSKNTAGFKTYEDSEIRRNKGTLLGSDTFQLKDEFRKAGVMAEQLRERGLSVDDLTNPRNYFKYFHNN